MWHFRVYLFISLFALLYTEITNDKRLQNLSKLLTLANWGEGGGGEVFQCLIPEENLYESVYIINCW